MAKVLLKPSVFPTSRLNCLAYSVFTRLNLFGIAGRLRLQDRGQCRAGVFGIDVDASAENGLVADVAACEVKASFHRQMSFVFDLLGDDFAENQLFGEVFGADDDAVGPRWTAGAESSARESERSGIIGNRSCA